MIQKGMFTLFLILNFSQISFAATEENSRSLAFVKKVFTEAQPKEHHEVALDATRMVVFTDEGWGPTISAGIAYGYFLSPTFQLDASAGYGGALGKQANGTSSYKLGAGLTLNFGSEEVKEKYFLSYHYTNTNFLSGPQERMLNYSSLSFGKRWEIGSWLVYKPNMQYFFSQSSRSLYNLNINLLVFSAIF